MTDREVLADALLSVTTVQELAQLLGVTFGKHLVYYLYRLHPTKRYIEFEINKRSGAGTRRISAPATSLKQIQQKLNVFLQAAYSPKKSVHGFLPDRGIATNASRHVRKRYVLNLDLEDFFGSINFGRVRGMFMAKPYNIPSPVATVLAQICCHENALPQGAPTSPIVSNMICSRLDKRLQDLATGHGCYYSRYADDITFSTNRARFPSELAVLSAASTSETLQVGDLLRQVIEANGFRVNASKTRLRTRHQRQEVTGLVVNQFTNLNRRYIRNIRAALHAWKKYGLDALQIKYLSDFNGKSRFPGKDVTSVAQALYGRIQHVGAIRGWDDVVYMRLRDEFNNLASRKIPVSVNPWLTSLTRSCWIIEDGIEANQGSAFFLKGYGLITNNHCVGQSPYIFHPNDPSTKIPVTVKQRHSVIDLAILTPAELPPRHFELDSQPVASQVQYGDDVTLVGYPEYAPGKSISIKQGKVHSFTMKSGIQRFNISTAIVFGNSGGPVLNRYNRVIGIAVTGIPSQDQEATATGESGVIPVSALANLDETTT